MTSMPQPGIWGPASRRSLRHSVLTIEDIYADTERVWQHIKALQRQIEPAVDQALSRFADGIGTDAGAAAWMQMYADLHRLISRAHWDRMEVHRRIEAQ
jgi:hypothetical protein